MGMGTASGLPVGLHPIPTSSQTRVIRGTSPVSGKKHKSCCFYKTSWFHRGILCGERFFLAFYQGWSLQSDREYR